MGLVWSYLWPTKSAEFTMDPSLDVPDLVTGITARQKLVVRENWNLVAKNLKSNGVEFFVALFTKHEYLKKYFVTLVDLPIEALPSSKKLQAHSTTVMMAISGLVDNLEDVECLKELLLKIGENHSRRKVSIEEFKKLAVVFVDFLEEKLGEGFTPFARKAWEEVFKVMNSIFEEGLKSANGS